jgi:hypothetical protein
MLRDFFRASLIKGAIPVPYLLYSLEKALVHLQYILVVAVPRPGMPCDFTLVEGLPSYGGTTDGKTVDCARQRNLGVT